MLRTLKRESLRERSRSSKIFQCLYIHQYSQLEMIHSFFVSKREKWDDVLVPHCRRCSNRCPSFIPELSIGTHQYLRSLYTGVIGRYHRSNRQYSYRTVLDTQDALPDVAYTRCRRTLTRDSTSSHSLDSCIAPSSSVVTLE